MDYAEGDYDLIDENITHFGPSDPRIIPQIIHAHPYLFKMDYPEGDYDIIDENITHFGPSDPRIIPQIRVPFLPLGLAIVFVTLLGIIGNVLSSYVLTRKSLRSSSYSVLTLGLTVVDTVYLSTKLLRYGLESLFSYCNVFYNYTDIFLPIVAPYLRAMTFTAHTASTYMTLAIAFDRYIVISRPSVARSFCTTKNARISTLIVISFAILYNIPRWWELYTDSYPEIQTIYGREIQVTKYRMKFSELRMNQTYKVYYIFWGYFLIMFFSPFFSLSVLNYLVWKGIKNIQKSGLTLTHTQSRDASFSHMLVGVVAVFLVCNSDYLILDLLDYFNIYYSAFWNDLGNFLLSVNSAVNFLIYCLCGRKFRHELREVVHKSITYFNRSTVVNSQDLLTSGVWIKDSRFPRRHHSNENPVVCTWQSRPQ